MFDPKSKVIDEIEFKVVPFPAITALRLKATLIKVIGPSLGMFLGSIDNTKSLSEAKINGEGVSRAIQSLFEQMNEDLFIILIKQLLSQVSCTIKSDAGTPLMVVFDSTRPQEFDSQINTVFQGKLMTIYPLMVFVLEVNFPDFFAKAKGIGSRLTTLMSEKANEIGEK